MTVTIQIDKEIRLAQLSWELVQAFGGPAPELRAVQGRSVTCYAGNFTDEQFSRGIDAHIADPGWVNPNPPLPAPLTRRQILATKTTVLTAAEIVEALQILLRGEP